MTKIVLVGSGNVSKHFFEAFSKLDTVKVIQVVGRNESALRDFDTTAKSTTDFSRIMDSDIYIICVSDNAVVSVSEHLTRKNGMVVHTSGSLPLNALSNHARRGVFYPLQTFSKSRKVDFKTLPICLEAHDKSDMEQLKNLAEQITGKIYEVSSGQRKALHLAAVFINNFTNHLCHIGMDICEENRLPFEILHPLLQETVDKIGKLSPFEAQTGPAIRNDTQTIESHLAQLENPDYKEIYTVLSQSIKKTHGKKL